MHTHRRNQVTDAHGYVVDDDGKILKDGEVLTVDIMLMDGMQRDVAAALKLGTVDAMQRVVAATLKPGTVGHRPGSLPITDADRAARVARQAAADAKLADQWKNPPAVQPVQQAPVQTAPAPVTAQDMAALYAKRDKALSEAWKGGAA